MNYSQIWKDILKTIYHDKQAILIEFSNNSIIGDYIPATKTLKIVVKKTYLEKLLISSDEKAKTLFEKYTKKPVINLYINNKQVEMKFVKKLTPINNVEESIIVRNKPISYVSIEKTFNDEVFIKERDLKANLETRTQNLDFYNKNLNKHKTLIFHKSDADYKKHFIFSLIFIWTLFVPIILLPVGFNKRSNYINLERSVKDLILTKYRPTNFYAKSFVKRLIK